MLQQGKHVVLLTAHWLLAAIEQSHRGKAKKLMGLCLRWKHIQLPGCQLEPEMAERKNPNILEF